MPWSPDDATRHTKKADSSTKKRQWADVADSILKKSDDEGSAIRQANAVVARNKGKRPSLAERVKAKKHA